ncbi:hypothetical protein [Holdemania massiliensis]|uniref:hypothetical protein n=1 Tax=Holdemania massiliensis TaxID=1468449 RepID=UPI0002E628A5|nr:hypothetical protein [Holdemania massiliensis]
MIKTGGQVRLLSMQASPDLLRRRAKLIEVRAAFEITKPILEERNLLSFEALEGEGEFTVESEIRRAMAVCRENVLRIIHE